MSLSASHELPVYSRLPEEIVSGDGVRVRTRAGRDLLDFYGGHAVALFGYRHPRLLAVLREQSETLFFQTNAADLSVRRRAAARLAAFAPDGLERVFFVNSGAEANENALRLAFRATRRRGVVALEGGFHGRTAASGACTHGSEGWYAFPRTPFPVTHVPPGDLDALDQALDADAVAALILEPVQGIAGARHLDLEYLRAARRITSSRGIWLIADEVQCGMGRCGAPFVVNVAGVVPEVITTAKGLGAGFPCSAVIVGESVAAWIGKGDLGTTFGGGPMACALIEAVVDLLEEPGTLENVRRQGQAIRDTCRTGPVTGIQGRGLLLGLRTTRPAQEVLAALRERGILAGGSRDPHVIRLMPPLILQAEHVEELRAALESIGP